jgi:hypothetical protein
MNIVDRLRDGLRQVSKPCSIVEVGLGPSEVHAIWEWARFAGPRHLRNDPVSFALAFVAAATAVARECADDHVLWPHVRNRFHGKPAEDLLPAGHPCTDLKEAIERAARELGLRHGFDRDRTEHRWYLTVLLQCGFTKPALRRLPEWLAGRQPWRAIDLLLNDPELSSDTFCQAFERLRGIRLGWYDNVQVSPWLGGGLDVDAPEAARARPALGTAAGTNSVVSRVRLVESGAGALAFRISLAVPPSIVVRAPPHIDVEIGGCRGPRAILQPDQSYSAVRDVRVDLTDVPSSGTIHVRLLSPEGSPLYEENVELFAGSDDIDLFVTIGNNEYRRATDPWTEPAPNRAAILRVADDLRVEGRFSTQPVRACRSLWQRVEFDQMSAAKVPLGDDLAWTFLLDGRRPWTGRVTVESHDGPWAPGEALVWNVQLAPSRARIRSARVGRQPLELENIRNGLTRLVLRAARCLPVSFTLRLWIEDCGERYTISYAAPPPECRDLFTRSDEGWMPVSLADPANLARPVRWFSQRSPDGDTPWLFEGGRPVMPLGDREVVLAGRLSGLGAPLCVESRRFNSDAPRVTLVESLADRLHLGPFDAVARCATIALRPGFSWREEFILELLGEDGIPRRASANDFFVDAGYLVLDADVALAAVAIVCRGETVAVATSERLCHAIGSAPTTADCVRWLFRHRIPVASAPIRDAIVRAIARQPLDALRLGLERDLLRDEFLKGFWRECIEVNLNRIDAALNGGERAVAYLLLERNMNPFTDPQVPGNAVACAVGRFAEYDPILAGRVLRAAIRSRDRDLQRVLTDARAEFRGYGTPGTPPPMEDIADVLSVDEGFLMNHLRTAIDWALGTAPNPMHVDNIRRLLYIPEFRRSVASDAIGRLLGAEGAG